MDFQSSDLTELKIIKSSKITNHNGENKKRPLSIFRHLIYGHGNTYTRNMAIFRMHISPKMLNTKYSVFVCISHYLYSFNCSHNLFRNYIYKKIDLTVNSIIHNIISKNGLNKYSVLFFRKLLKLFSMNCINTLKKYLRYWR